MFKYAFSVSDDDFFAFSEGPFKDVWFQFGDPTGIEQPENEEEFVMPIIMKNEEDVRFFDDDEFVSAVSEFVQYTITKYIEEYKGDFEKALTI